MSIDFQRVILCIICYTMSIPGGALQVYCVKNSNVLILNINGRLLPYICLLNIEQLAFWH